MLLGGPATTPTVLAFHAFSERFGGPGLQLDNPLVTWQWRRSEDFTFDTFTSRGAKNHKFSRIQNFRQTIPD